MKAQRAPQPASKVSALTKPSTFPAFFQLSILTGLFLIVLAGTLVKADALDATGPEHDQCYTQVFWDMENPQLKESGLACNLLGDCDIAGVRDWWIPDSSDAMTILKIYFHVMRADDGSNPAVTEQNVADAVEDINGHYLPLRIQFEYEMRFVNSSQFRYLTSNAEFDQMKNAYAIAPDSQLNVWVASVNVDGSVFSFGTFPWSADALGKTGGIVMNNTQFPPFNDRTLTHEIGHNLGLWHTHHGVDEVTPCGPCYEYARTPADDRGDFCSDTDPTPTNYGCGAPDGVDQCSFETWGPTNPENHMGYGGCRDQFSMQQWGRMHCWMNEVLTSWQLNVKIAADTVLGPVPLEVNFAASTPKSATSWEWDFGDGGSATVQNPTYTYTEGGLYDVAVTIQTPDGPYSTVAGDYIAAYADTVDIEEAAATPGKQVRVDVYANNRLPLRSMIIPFSYGGTFDMMLDSGSVAGLRTEYVDIFQKIVSDNVNRRAAYSIVTSADGSQPLLAPDTGAVMSLFFTVSYNATEGPNPIEITSVAGYSPSFTAQAGVYEPVLVGGSVDFCRVGDFDDDGDGPDIADLAYLVDYLFRGGAAPAVSENSDLNGSGGAPNVADLTYLVDYLFNSGPPPVC